MTTQQVPLTEQILEYYTRASGMTAPGRYAPMFAKLPNELTELVRIVQALAIHEFVAADMYEFKVPADRKPESHIRSVERMLERLFEIDDKPLTTPRPPERRLVGTCHHFLILLLAMLRAKGVPARARCGFGSYFNPPFFEDHWLCEVWNADQERWVLVDPQFDEKWRSDPKIDHDVMDVPRDRFLVAADAWALVRGGKAAAAKFGTVNGDLHGLWFIAIDLMHDLAALNKVEMLPWDVWGAMPQPNEDVQGSSLELCEHVAALTRAPDTTFADLRRLYENDERVRVPRTVFNALLNRVEVV
jgi:hypothetical protein